MKCNSDPASSYISWRFLLGKIPSRGHISTAARLIIELFGDLIALTYVYITDLIWLILLKALQL